MSIALPSYLDSLIDYVTAEEKIVVGAHSGTSADGPTVVIARVSGATESATARIQAVRTFEYPPQLRAVVLACSDRSTATVDMLVQADMAVGEFFADCILELIAAEALTPSDVALVAASGQITYQVIPGQRPEHMTALGREYMGMLDLGDGAVIALRTGILTVSGLRRKDNHAGGFGAPMVPFGDWVSFRSSGRARVVWNIGGICNATVIPPASTFPEVWAFDAGPGNMIIDQLTALATDGAMNYDADGVLAAAGKVHAGMIADYMRDAFIRQDPPKAAARQIYGTDFVATFWADGHQRGLSAKDIVATATQLTVETIAFAQKTYIDPTFGDNAEVELVFAGGGTLNPVLMQGIHTRLPHHRISASEAFGVPAEAREALAMLLVANETIHGRPSNCVPATGATRAVIQGRIDVPN